MGVEDSPAGGRDSAQGPEKNMRILLIDDSQAIHDDFRKILGGAPKTVELDDLELSLFGRAPQPAGDCYRLDSAYQGQEGYDRVCEARQREEPYALAFVDMRMPPGWDGLETIDRVCRVDPDIQLVICSAYSDYAWEEIRQHFGKVDRLLILKKPFDPAEVSQLACALTEKWRLARSAKLEMNQLEAMVTERTGALEREIVERKRSEQALRASEARYALASAGANDGLWDWDLEHGTIFYSERWKSMLGLSETGCDDGQAEWFDRIHPDDLAGVTAALQAHLDGLTDHFQSEYRMQHRDGTHRWMLCRGLVVRDAAGKAIRAAGSQTDVTDRRLAEEKLRHDAHHDDLTGLANRTLLMDRLSNDCRRARQFPDYCFAVLFLDLDRFKVINDSLGHLLGDQLLIRISRRLQTLSRTTDTLARVEKDYLARIGGDEFVLLLHGVGSPSAALQVAERVQRALCDPFVLEGHEVFSSACIGIAMGHPGYERPEDILRDADTALYQAKAAGTGRCVVFRPDMHVNALARWKTETELRRGLERDEMRLYYQPILSLSTSRVIEMEALIRWQHPERGVVPPGDFIPLAEETGLIIPLGLWALREACTQLRRWQLEQIGMEQLSVGVNVSGKQFARPELVAEFSRVLRETGADPAQIKLEITETEIMERAASTISTLQKLRELGLSIHLDDFGTGYSSLSYLNRMPIDALKIDRSFVSSLGQDPLSRSIVQAIITLAHVLNMRVIAEGVETEVQLEQLRQLDCDAAQGYLFSRPMEAAQAFRWLREHREKAAG